MKRPLLCAMIVSIGACGSPADAQPTYPPRPVRMYVGFPPGGATDVIARLLAPGLAEYFRVGFVVDNRPGAAGTIAAELAASAPPDGTTLLVVSAAFASAASLYPKLAYQPLRDFVPITRVAATDYIVVTHPSVPARSVKELVALAKRHPGKVTFASAGLGSGSHLTLELLRMKSGGMNVLHVPHRGLGPAVLDLLAGEVHAVFATLPATIVQIRNGQLRPLGVASLKRAQALAAVPTLDESGYPGFEATAWNGVLAPAGVSYDVVIRLQLAIAHVANSREVRSRLAGLGAEVIADAPDQFSQYLRGEIAKWAEVARVSGVRLGD